MSSIILSKLKQNKFIFLVSKIILTVCITLSFINLIIIKKLILPFLLSLLLSFCQFFVKQDTVLLFDTTEKLELIDAYSLFEYIQEKNIKSYYIIDKKQPQFAEIYNKYKDNLIVIDEVERPSFSIDLFLKLIKTKYIFTSFNRINIDPILKYVLNNNKNIEHIFVQHGLAVLKPRALTPTAYNKRNFDKVVIANDVEEYIYKTYGGFTDNDIIKAGLSRWDNLKKVEKRDKSIFIFFTWRRTFSEKSYNESQYYKNINSLLNNEKLNKLLTKHNITLYYGVHHSILTYSKDNFNIYNKNIKTIDVDTVSDYIKECDLLITDFSGVSFDFLFLEKPVIYYLLDFNNMDYLNERDKEDVKQANKQLDLIFNKVFTEEDVIKLVEYYIDNDFKLEESKVKISNQFFYQKKDIRKTIIEKLGLESNK